MENDNTSCEINVQFVDDDRIDRMLWNVPLKFIPAIGDSLNIMKDGLTYFLTIQDVTHIVDYMHGGDISHSVTITADCEKVRARN